MTASLTFVGKFEKQGQIIKQDDYELWIIDYFDLWKYANPESL